MLKSNLNPELEKLENFLEKYVKTMKNEVSYYDEKLKLEEISKKQQPEFQLQKQELEAKIEKAQSYLDKIKVPENRNFIDLGKPKKYWGSTEGLDKPLCERYYFEYGDNKSDATLDITKELSDRLGLKLNSEDDNFYVAEETLVQTMERGGITIKNESEVFLKRHLVEAESNKGKFFGLLSGFGTGAAGGAAVGAGAMVLLSPYTFGLSLSLTPMAATIGAIAGGLGGGTAGLATGAVVDKLSNSKVIEIKNEIKYFLEDYKTMIEKESCSCQNIVNDNTSTSEEKEKSQKQKEYYDNEIKEMKAYIENNY